MANEQKLQRDDIIDLMANMNRGWGFISAIGVIGIVIGIIFTVIRLLR